MVERRSHGSFKDASIWIHLFFPILRCWTLSVQTGLLHSFWSTLSRLIGDSCIRRRGQFLLIIACPLWLLAFLKPLFQIVSSASLRLRGTYLSSVARGVRERGNTHTHTPLSPAVLNGQRNVLYKMDFSHVTGLIGICFLFLKMNRAPLHCLGILCFMVVIITS